MNEEARNVIGEIKNADNALKSVLKRFLSEENDFDGIIKKIADFFNMTFKLNNIGSGLYNIPKNGYGIYFFFIFKKSEEIEFFKDWENFKTNVITKQGMKCPNPNKLEFGDNSILYIGKSEGDLKKRISQHINGTENSTAALHLQKFKNYNDNYDFKYGFISSDDTDLKYVLTVIEGFLHENFRPLTGRK